MAVIVAWEDDTQSTLCVTLQHRWEWEDIENARTQINTMLDSLTYKVDLMVCGDTENWLPGNFNQNMLNLTQTVHPNLGLVVIVTSNVLFEQLFRLFVRLRGGVPFDFLFVESVEAARSHLKQPASA